MDGITSKTGFFSPNFATYGIIILSTLIFCGFRWGKKIQEYLKYRSMMMKFTEQLPDTPTLPIIGKLLRLSDINTFPYEITKLSRQMNFTTFKMWNGPILYIILGDPRDVEIVMKSQKSAKKGFPYDTLAYTVKNGLVTLNGPTYKLHKTVVLKLINEPSYFKNSLKKIHRYSEKFVKKLEEVVDKPQFNAQHLLEEGLGPLVLDTIYGSSSVAPYSSVLELYAAFDQLLRLVSKRFLNPLLWSDWLFSISPIGREYHKVMSKIQIWLSLLIDKRMEELRKGTPEEIDKTDGLALFEMIMRHAYKTNEWSRQDLIDEAITLFLAGYNTLADMLCFILLMLAIHPDAQEKARKEAKNMIIDDTTGALNLEYIEMVVKETIRLYPVAPIRVRETTDELKLATCTLPKGCLVMLLMFTFGRNPNYWQDPDKFKPERFLNETAGTYTPGTFYPFSGGPRICPGAKFGMTLLKIMLAHILCTYRIETSVKLEEVRTKTHISMYSDIGCPISFKRA